jgi:flagellar basal body-associated protein FliL
MKKKIILSVLVLIVAFVAGVWFFIFYKPTHFKRDVADEKGIVTTSKEIVKEFQTNETTANAKYLNKAVQITGEVAEAKKDQTGKTTVTIKSDDAMSNVFVTLKDGTDQPVAGTMVNVKGLCTGYLSDVVIIDAVLIK